jgi:NADPH:quinone reductase-like Zn-dependent oxidoreductase
MTDFEVRRDDLRTTRVVAGEERKDAVGEGEVQLRVERFGLTANNVTYGVMGDALSYWQFFAPSEDGWGRVPAWAFGDVVASGVDGIAAGERFYGYFPMSAYVTYRPQPGGGGFVEASEHRRALPPVYNRYVRTPPDAPHLDETLLLRPLFATSFLLEDFVGGGDTDAVVLSSASSKTAYGLAFLLARGGGPRVIGLTSRRNREFVESIDAYDRVLSYDEIRELGGGEETLAFVDMAGDAAVREAVHAGAGERLRRSVVVGATHWEELGGGGELPGPAPEFFFAPTHIERLQGEVGPEEFQRRLGEAWDAFVAKVGDWLDVEHAEGPEALERVWRQLVDGGVDPRRGHVLTLPG